MARDSDEHGDAAPAQPSPSTVDPDLRRGPHHEQVASAETRLMARLGLGPAGSATPTSQLRLVGRYVLHEWLGSGAAGVVYEAHDPTLDRRVALKLLHRKLNDPRQQQRMQREALALAQLSDPNVVQIYEVGLHENQVFLAMEFIDGMTLRQWLAADSRPLAAVLAVLVGAGNGLAAAHAAGLVHRDFKPDNILVGRNGRARVADFGLARPSQTDPAPLPEQSPPPAKRKARGGVAGTPAYMAPEQASGDAVGAATDQYSFCVSAYEALVGRRPPRRGPTWTTPSGSDPRRTIDVPRYVRRALARGLSHDPGDRWPSMEPLLAELQSDPAGKRRTVIARSFTLAVGGAAVYAAMAVGNSAAERCETRAATELSGTWNEARREAVRVAVLSADAPFSRDTWTRLEPALNDYAAAWQDGYHRACEAQVDDTTAGELRVFGCLHARRRDLDAALSVLAQADTTVVANAVQAISGLRSMHTCDTNAGAESPRAEPARRRLIVRVEQALSEAQALQLAGKYQQGAEVLDQVRSVAAHADSDWLGSQFGVRNGALMLEMGEYADAERVLEQAFFDARVAGNDSAAREAARMLAQAVGVHLHRQQDGMRWASHMCADARRATESLSIAACESVRGNVLHAQGEYAAAERHHLRAVALREGALGNSHLSVAQSLHNLGSARYRQGAYEPAFADFERSLAILEVRLGHEHPEVASTLATLGAAAFERGKYEIAGDHLRRALEIREQTLGGQHPEIPTTLVNLANLYDKIGDPQRARSHYERAIALMTEALGSSHPDLALARFNLGNLLAKEGELSEASEHFEAVLKQWQASLGEAHPHVAIVLNSLGNIAFERGELKLAKDRYEQALQIRRSNSGPEHPNVTYPMSNIGSVLLAQGQLDAALEIHREVLRIRQTALGGEHVDTAATLHNIGDVLREQGRCAEAIEQETAALLIVDTALGDESLVAIPTLVGLARCSIASSDASQAVHYATRALAIGEAHDAPPQELADAQRALADALLLPDP